MNFFAVGSRGSDAGPTTGHLFARRCLGVGACLALLVSGIRLARADERNGITPASLRLAIEALHDRFPETYDADGAWRGRLDRLAADKDAAASPQLLALAREALFANPSLDFDRILFIRRGAAGTLGLPQNWEGNCALNPFGYDNQIAVLHAPFTAAARRETLFEPKDKAFVGDIDLHFDADRLLVSMPGSHRHWQIWELGIDGSGLRQVTRGEYPDVHNYSACYLPDGQIVFSSTRVIQGVPCVGGGRLVGNLFRMNADGSGVRQLCFDQDHNWYPKVMNNGRVIYTRWEYSDSPHYFTRLLFHMNPDGTQQAAYYGSNSMWPNSMFYARPLPGHPTRVVTIVSGHHGVRRMGELYILDPALGRHEADGVVQQIPGRGVPVKAVMKDQLVNHVRTKFLHPYPVDDDTFLVSCQPTPQSAWGLYLVDTFDNRLLLAEEPGYVLFEPIPLRPRLPPLTIPDRVNTNSTTATVYLSDVYAGPGLAGIPRGAVKNLRVYEYHYAYPNMGGHLHIGIDGPWDARRLLGTVPVLPDGSAAFTAPANTPLAVQPLDEEGKALQVMRSWFTAMPGEVVSCVGCHEPQNRTAMTRPTLAAGRPPSPIKPWYGPVRGFSFKREVQGVLDRHCISCHGAGAEAAGIPDLRGNRPAGWRGFTPSYIALHPYVRRPGPESDYHMQIPMEFHADTSELVQMLRKGHYNVVLDAEDWDRLVTWMDLNVPDHGTWGEHNRIPGNFHQRRLEMRSRYANRSEDPEFIPELSPRHEPVPRTPAASRTATPVPEVAGWPFDAATARAMQTAAGQPETLRLDLGEGLFLDMVLVPAGSFVMGSADGAGDERPPAAVRIEHPFYMSKYEITNKQFARFEPRHDSAYISMTNKDIDRRGHPVNAPDQPVVRISWERAMAFCAWAAQQTGRAVRLPTEAQWEWACRAGSADAFAFGGADADFSAFANMGDRTLGGLARRDSPPWHPRDNRFSDGALVSAAVGRYKPNAWGLHDMHGNVWEWTLSSYRPYPYREDDGRNAPDGREVRTARGGSWYDRPYRNRAAFRLPYQPYQGVYNVGFRVAVPILP